MKPSKPLNFIQLWIAKNKLAKLERQLQELALSHAKETKSLASNVSKDYVMATFDQKKMDRIVDKIVKSRQFSKVVDKATPVYNSKKGTQYGLTQKEVYYAALIEHEVLQKILRANAWLMKKDWTDQKIPVNATCLKLFNAAINYAEVLKFYYKEIYVERQKLANKG